MDIFCRCLWKVRNGVKGMRWTMTHQLLPLLFYYVRPSRFIILKEFWTSYSQSKQHESGTTYMLSGIWKLLFNPFHDFPEGGSVEGVSIPAGPHNVIPAHRHTNTFISAQLLHPLSLLCAYSYLFSVPPKSFNTSRVFVTLTESQMQQDGSGPLFKSPHYILL